MGDIMLLPELKKETVRISNPDQVNRVIHQMAAAGSKRLQVAADFDFTLSRFRDDKGDICDSCYRAFEQSTVLPVGYKEDARNLLQRYYPIEVDPTMTIEQKIPHMMEWWTKSHSIIVSCNIRQDSLPVIIKESRIQLREGCDWLFARLHELSVPLLIFSAGVGDIIHAALKERAHLYDNMKVVSNFMEFNSEGIVTGFKGELMHVFNKNEHSIQSSDYFTDISKRDSIILLGDSLGDLRMADGAVNCQQLLRIGFLNDKIDERLEEYMREFDVVLVNDQTMDIPNAIIRYISDPGSLVAVEEQAV